MARPTIYRRAGALMLGSRLKRLGERLIGDVGRLYRREGLPFEPSWFPLFFLLQEAEAVTVTDVARGLGVTDSGASQLVRSVQQQGFVEVRQSAGDRRVKQLRLTEAGRELLEAVQPVWSALRESLVELFGDDAALGRLAATLDALEDRLAAHLERQRVASEVSLRAPRPEQHERWRRLVLDWLVAPPGRDALPPELVDGAARGPEGGHLLAAWREDEPLGCVATRAVGEGRHELVFLGAHRARGGLELERRLLDGAIDALRDDGVRALLAPARPDDGARLRLLRERGFELADPTENPPERERLWLTLDLREEA